MAIMQDIKTVRSRVHLNIQRTILPSRKVTLIIALQQKIKNGMTVVIETIIMQAIAMDGITITISGQL